MSQGAGWLVLEANEESPTRSNTDHFPEKTMNRNFLTLTLCFVLGIILAARLEATDGLKSAFGSASPNTNTAPHYSPIQLGQFIQSLTKSEIKSSDDKTAYAFEYSVDDLNFPTWMHINSDNTMIWAHYNLAAIPAEANPADYAAKLLDLLAHNGNYGDYFFSFDPEHRMITVYGCLQVRGPITDNDLKTHLDRMAHCARETENLWNPAAWNKTMPQHVGTWHAAANNMTLSLTGSNSFELRVNGQVLSGQYTIDGDALIMQDTQGEKIQGNVRFDNANQFSLIINGAQIQFVRQ